MVMIERSTVKKLAVTAVAGLLAACAKEPPPPPPPPPPPVVVIEPEPIPLRPALPAGAYETMVIPALDANGVRMTVNAGLGSLETVWNFRSAMNVAALNCMQDHHQPILEYYKIMLKQHSTRLSKVNADLDRDYRSRHGTRANATRVREAYMTQVYNYFALPPATPYFCAAALELSQEALLSPPSDIDAFALAGLPKLEAAFERFFQDMERYRIASAAWDAKYRPPVQQASYMAQPTVSDAGFGTLGGGVYTSATYGPPAAPALDVTLPPPVAEEFNLAATQGIVREDDQQFVSQPVVQGAPEEPQAEEPSSQPEMVSQPVIQPLP